MNTTRLVTLTNIRKVYVSVPEGVSNSTLEDLYKKEMPEHHILKEIEIWHEVKVENI